MLKEINAAKAKIQNANLRLQVVQAEYAELETALCEAQRKVDDAETKR